MFNIQHSNYIITKSLDDEMPRTFMKKLKQEMSRYISYYHISENSFKRNYFF